MRIYKSVYCLLFIVSICVVTAILGCDRTLDMLDTVESVIEDPADTKEQARQKARDTVISAMTNLETFLITLFSDTQSIGVSDAERDKVFFEATGFEKDQVLNLIRIHLEENAELDIVENKEYVAGWTDVAAKYLELTFIYPDKMEDEILELFRGYARDGETTILWSNVEASYFPDKFPDGLYFDYYEKYFPEADDSILNTVYNDTYRVHFRSINLFSAAKAQFSVTAQEQASREKAREIVIETVYEIIIVDEPDGDLTDYNNRKEKIIFEKTGLTWTQVGNLMEIHLQENTSEAQLVENEKGVYSPGWIDVVAKYLEIAFADSTKTVDEILKRFREYARFGETTVYNLATLKANYFYEYDDPNDDIQILQPYIPDVAIAFDITDEN